MQKIAITDICLVSKYETAVEFHVFGPEKEKSIVTYLKRFHMTRYRRYCYYLFGITGRRLKNQFVLRTRYICSIELQTINSTSHFRVYKKIIVKSLNIPTERDGKEAYWFIYLPGNFVFKSSKKRMTWFWSLYFLLRRHYAQYSRYII